MSKSPNHETTFPLAQWETHSTDRRNLRGLLLLCFIVSSLVSSTWLSVFVAEAIEVSSERVKVLEIPVPTESIPKTLTFPVYEQEGIQYFSAGLGTEERMLTYPPFPLKLIFVQGERAYLAGVSVILVNQSGTQHIQIPGKDVEGPWLFMNIPTGTYRVSGTDSNGITIEKTISVKTDKSTVVYFRFP